jgi:hypothetical protein
LRKSQIRLKPLEIITFTNSRWLPDAFYRGAGMTVCDRDLLPAMAAVECLFWAHSRRSGGLSEYPLPTEAV